MTWPGTRAASAELEEGLGPSLLVRGELSVFLARLDDDGQPTNIILPKRRHVNGQSEMVFDIGHGQDFAAD